MNDERSPLHHLPRRNLFGVVAGLALSAAGGRRTEARAAAAGAIDVHHHFLPPLYKTRIEDLMRAGGGLTPEANAWTPERSVAVMDRAGIETAVLSAAASRFDFPDGAHWARQCNEYASQMAASHPGRFRYFAGLPMPDVEASIREAEHALEQGGAVGVGLLTNYEMRWLGDPAFTPLFEMLNRRKALVYVHPTGAPCCVGVVPGVQDAFVEFPVNTARTIVSLLWSGTLSRFADMRLIFSHGGGALPMLLERVAMAGHAIPNAAALVPEGPAAALSKLYVDTATVTNPVAMAAVRSWLKPAHILFGTDYPWGAPERTAQQLDALNLPRAELAGIRRGNALSLLAGNR